MVRSPGQRAGLDSTAVLSAARAVLAERGAEGLSMRAVATQLGVAPNALYSHVENRTALVDAVLDDILGGVREPSLGEEPAAALRDLMLASFDVVVEHPSLVPTYLARQGSRGPEARRLGDAMQALLGQAGVDDATARLTIRMLIVHMLGFAALATSPDGPIGAAELRRDLRVGLEWLLAGAFASGS